MASMSGARARLIAGLLAATAAGCGASAGNGSDDQVDPDARRGADARVDAQPGTPDARPCVEGEMRGVDPATGTCITAHTTARVPWDDARAQCQAIGADLAVITSAADNAFFTSVLGMNEAFVGANDRAVEGTFRWVDDSVLTYTNWRTGEPSNGGGGYQEDCIILQGQLDGVWDDRPCDSSELAPPAGTHFFLCAR
jgi:hypothetical protein